MSDVQGFFAAIRAGDMGKVKAMLAEDVAAGGIEE